MRFFNRWTGFAFVLLFAGASHAAGPYDGIWHSEDYGYLTVHENNGDVVIAQLDTDTEGWSALTGQRSENMLHVETAIGRVKSVIDVVITSETTFSATQVSCEPILAGSSCGTPNGHIFSGTKVW